MYRLICLVLGYAIGCIQVAYTICRRASGIDIREHGSGNAGTTNVIRVMGPKMGLLVFALDVLKGIAAFVLCSVIFGGSSAFFSGPLGLLPGLYGGLGAVLGHDYPIQLKGRGGKGSATTVGIILLLDWRLALICYLAGAIAIALTRYISLGSMVVAVSMAILLAVFRYPPEAICIGLVIAGLSVYQHRANIDRLIHGKENKFNFKKQL